jgi:hypothetical protein
MPKTEKMMVYMDAETVSLQINKLRGELLKIADILAGPTMIKKVVADLDRATRENQATNSSTTGH